MLTKYKFLKTVYWGILGILIVGLLAISTSKMMPSQAQTSPPVGIACVQPTAGSIVADPLAIDGSQSTTLIVNADPSNPDRNCFLYNDPTTGWQEAPTLRVAPGNALTLNLQNALPGAVQLTNNPCPWDGGMPPLNATSLHYHGLNVSPKCTQDNSVETVVVPGQTFGYNIPIPNDEPPGLYWYHPHVHMQAESQVLSGLTGAIIVDGIGSFNDQASKLPERVFVLRDLNLLREFSEQEEAQFEVPAHDVSINSVPIRYLGQGQYDPPAVIQMQPNEQQFWRVANTSADTIFDLQVTYDGAVQTLNLVGMDGVPVNAENQTLPASHVLLGPGGRAEFIITGPGEGVKDAQFLTLKYDTNADFDPQRTIAKIEVVGNPATLPSDSQFSSAEVTGDRFSGLSQVNPVKARTLYFSQQTFPEPTPEDPNAEREEFYITEEGKTPQIYMMGGPPAITVREGTTEDWTVENRADEAHVFHIHQIHFLVLDSTQPEDIGMTRDTIIIPAWTGGPYPSVKLRMDFRGLGTGKTTTSIAGTFLYHCHILEHEDGGMMQAIAVEPVNRRRWRSLI
jgi:FtsP/CotA-like multicopper oxidase with cupredoxin domain